MRLNVRRIPARLTCGRCLAPLPVNTRPSRHAIRLRWSCQSSVTDVPSCRRQPVSPAGHRLTEDGHVERELPAGLGGNATPICSRTSSSKTITVVHDDHSGNGRPDGTVDRGRSWCRRGGFRIIVLGR
jgi:hypothetical protein